MNDTNFYPMDKLVEFGMEVGIANQMAQNMNKALNQMQFPGSGNPMQRQNPENIYYAVLEGKSAGPFSLTELARLIKEKKIVKETYIWKPGMKNWELAENITEVSKLVALTPPPVPSN